jgi:hypothetical protein
MNKTEKLEFLITNKKNVVSVYSGRPGCMCGCRGKHSYSKKHRKYSSKERGYNITVEEISDVTVTRMINKFEKLIKNGWHNDVHVDELRNYMFFETPTRHYVIYFKKS